MFHCVGQCHSGDWPFPKNGRVAPCWSGDRHRFPTWSLFHHLCVQLGQELASGGVILAVVLQADSSGGFVKAMFGLGINWKSF